MVELEDTLVLETSSLRVKVQVLLLRFLLILMLLYPKKTKFRTLFSRKRVKFLSTPNFNSSIKSFAIISLENAKRNNKQIDSLRKTLKRLLKSYGKYWINTFPDKNLTKKTEGVRMGKGKGNIKLWYGLVSKGSVISEINGCSWIRVKRIMSRVKSVLSVKTFLIVNRNLS